MSQNGTMIVPLLSGSGLKVKILEAMAIGTPIIASSIAAEGINYTNFKNIIIADSLNEYINAIETIKDPLTILNISQNAQNLIKTEYNIKTITTNLINEYTKLLCQ
jgi:glycosyltransferase involved in cell wall biosynthesis